MSLQMLIKELRAGVISADPVLMTEKVMYLVRVNQLFEVHAVRSQPSHQTDGLRKLDVAIVVAVNQPYGRFPFIDRRNGRRLSRDSIALGGVGRHSQTGNAHAPIVHAVKIHSGGKDV